MNKIGKTVLFLCVLCGTILLLGSIERTEASIVLDPGHDSTHSGASGNGVSEETLNLKIAQYCYEELQNYNGVGLVYMTRNGMGCPYPGTTSTQCNKKRVQFAKSMGAVLYVSLHNNSASSPAAKGATVYYPNGSYRSSIGVAGERLANIVQSHLIALGLKNRGTQIRNSEDNTRYPDGSIADYYGVIKNSKLSGFTAIIVEHAFVSNAEDVAAYLSTDAQLKLLGIADATAIAEYYGLSKVEVWDKDVSKTKVSTSFTPDYKKVTTSISGLSKAPSVTLAVWSDKDGQNDLRWYNAVKDSSGNWVFDIPIADFKKSGKYNLHVYAGDGNVSLCASTTTFSVDGPKVQALNVGELNKATGQFDIDLNGVSSNVGIDYVKVAVWSKSDQSDLKWITAEKTSGENYHVSVNLSDYKYTKGDYNIHAYISDKNGIFDMAKKTSYTVTYPQASISGGLDLDDISFTVNASDFPFQSEIAYVKVAVWSDENAQDDLEWYMMNNDGHKFTVNEYFTKHLTDGASYAHVYAYMKNGTSIYSGDLMFTPNQTKISGSYNGKLNDDLSVLWSGNRVNVIADKGKINIKDITVSSGDISGESTEVSQDSVEVSGSSTEVSQDSVEVSGGSTGVSPMGVTVSDGTISVSEDSVNVSNGVIVLNKSDVTLSSVSVSSDNNITAAAALIADNMLMKEEIYTLKDNIGYYKGVKKLMSNYRENMYRSFVIRRVDLSMQSEKYSYSFNDKIRVQFKLPAKYVGKDIVIYELKNDGENISLGEAYDVLVTEHGYAEIITDKMGDYVIAADKVNLLKGDMDFDGEVTLADAVTVLKASLNIIELSDELKDIADFNSDGNLNLEDAQLVLKAALGIS